jgi:F-type H+-transporting ATPase subunit delta
VQPATLRLVQYAIEGGRPRDILGTLYWLVDRTAEARGWRVAQVDSAREVDDDERALLSSSLGRLTGSPVELQVTVDPSLLAGVRVRIGDLQVEATARGRLEELREHMASGGWEDSGLGAVQRNSNAEGAQ